MLKKLFFAFGALLIAVLLYVGYRAWLSDPLTRCLDNVSPDKLSVCSQALRSTDIDITTRGKIFTRRAIAHYQLRQFDLSIQDLNEALKLIPSGSTESLDSLLLRAELLTYEGNLNAALADANLALKIDNNSSYAYAQRGLIQRRLGKPKLAISDYSRALSINPNDAWTYNNRGFAYMFMGQYQKALEDTKTALRIDPNDSNTRHSLGEIYFYLGEKEKALKIFRDVCQSAPIEQIEEWKRRLLVTGFFNGAIADGCNEDLIKAFHECVKSKCTF